MILKATLSKLAPNFSRWKPQSGPLKNLSDYMTTLVADYKAVFTEAAQDARRRPLKASIIAGFIGLGIAAKRNNPQWRDFKSQLMDASNELTTVHESVRNQASKNYVDNLNQLANERILRYFSFGIASVIWEDTASPECALYEAKCKYVKPTLWQLRENVVDIGIWGKWRILEKYMKDFDVNPFEWETKESIDKIS